MHRFQNQCVVITGGNSGIGKGMAKQFLKEGARVAILGRNPETLAATEKELSPLGELLCIQGDVSKTEDLKHFFKDTHRAFGNIQTVIANAGTSHRKALKDVTEEDFDTLIDTNYRAVFFTAQHALPYMEHPSSMILVASIAASVTLHSHSVYASSKAAIVRLAKSLSRDLAPEGIRVNSLSPGVIETPIFDQYKKDNPDILKEKGALIPLGYVGQPVDIAHAALFLASNDASYITGTDLVVDGGYTASWPGS